MSTSAPEPTEKDCQSSMAPMTRLVVVVPLYMYPVEGAWDPLFEAARAHPEVAFVAIANPNSGPGKDALPDASYLAALREMSGIDNIRCLGYGSRALDTVNQDVDVYRLWNTSPDHAIRVDGIFFDEAPSDPQNVEYMRQASSHVHETWQSELHRPGEVMLNPGVVVDREYYDLAEHVVVFEQSEEQWQKYFVTQGLPQVASSVRSKAVAIVHSCGTAQDGLGKLVREVKSMGFGGLCLTEQVGGGYSKWPKQLPHIVALVAEP
ncbi:hypothetical protein NLU13_6550 [Sarocladium strictum]|uniref:Spherulation-specific family 4 n=1 Tax=Sarocladium strictum TaxID=5046 RepID=A0AA39GG44_SARSR|nr:hypothetical protein NLU13_6550 [Sarocladium strictum]